MHDPVSFLRDDPALIVRSTPHRFHTTGQTLDFVRHMTGKKPWTADMLHLVSDYAAEQLLSKGMKREDLLASFEALKRLWDTFEVFVIEICARREFEADLGQGRYRLVNTFTQRDQERYAQELADQAARGLSLPAFPIRMRQQSGPELQQDMADIRRLLRDRPVIWVSHMRPGGEDPRYSLVNKIREQGAKVLQDSASLLGDQFFDPSSVVPEMGIEQFFQKGGEDLDHLTPEAAKRLAQIYKTMILKASYPA